MTVDVSTVARPWRTWFAGLGGAGVALVLVLTTIVAGALNPIFITPFGLRDEQPCLGRVGTQLSRADAFAC